MTGDNDQERLRLTVIGPDGRDAGVTRVVVAAADDPRALIPTFTAMVHDVSGGAGTTVLDDYELLVASADGRAHYLLRCDTRGDR
ncbi:MAG: hypothetical protein AB7I38_17745 [Dehalococcoidia bacterium]